MSKNIYSIFLSVLSVFMFCSCGSENFRISGDFKDFGTQNMRIIYVVGNNANILSMPVVDGKFDYTGKTEEMTIVELYNRHMELLTRVAVENGDEIKISGSIKEPYKMKVSGSSVNEDWFDWQNDHADILAANDRHAIETAIEKYAKTNKRDLLSGLLITCTYINSKNHAKAEVLLESLNESAKPEFIRNRINIVGEAENQISDKTAATFSLYCSKDTIARFNPANSKASLIYFWSENNAERAKIVKELKSLTKKYPSKNDFKISDITFETDTAVWKRAVRTDSVKWQQFWGVGGKMNATVKGLQVENAPYFIVTDSKGNITYRGESFEKAKDSVESKIKKESKKLQLSKK